MAMRKTFEGFIMCSGGREAKSSGRLHVSPYSWGRMISTQSSSESCTDNTGASENTAKELGSSI
jgi:hypothetical protein